jgi:hypothetical protein
MFGDWYRPDSTLEFPVGGSGAIVDALVRGRGLYSSTRPLFGST